MSRFSKAQAEKAGWVFVHEQEERESALGGGQQGLRQTLPASYRAEKYVETAVGGETLINEEAETMGLLLERINAYETTHGGYEDTSAPPEGDASEVNPFTGLTGVPELTFNENPKVSTEKNDIAPEDNETQLTPGDEFTETVQTPDGNFSEHEFFGRRSDEAVAAHEAFLARQRELELSKPIDPQPTATEAVAGEEPEATEAAVEYADAKGVDLSLVEPDKSGKITKGSVKLFLRRSK